MKTKQKSKKVFMGAFVEPSLKEDLKKISKAERRSLNAQVEFFLSLGVQHLKEQKQAA
jgi:hypothetical protein